MYSGAQLADFFDKLGDGRGDATDHQRDGAEPTVRR